jgi:cytochrome c
MHCCHTFKNARRAIAVSIALSLPPAVAQTVDLAGAEALARKSACFKCHAVEREKDGPAFKDVAARARGKADAEAGLVRFFKTGAKPGKESGKELHPQVKSSDEAEIANLVRYVLSR